MFTTKIIAEHGAALHGAVSFGMPIPESNFCERALALDRKREAGGCAHAGMAYLHIKQMYAAINACIGKTVDCQVSELLKSPAEPRFCFLQWQNNHQAVFKDGLRFFTDGQFE